MKTLEITTNIMFERENFETGTVREFGDADAQSLIDQGLAKLVKAEKTPDPEVEEAPEAESETEPTDEPEPAEAEQPKGKSKAKGAS